MRFALPLTILLLQLVGCGGPSQSASRTSTLDRILSTRLLRVGMNPGYAPFEMIDLDGNMVGFDVDVARYVAGQMGNGVRWSSGRATGIPSSRISTRTSST